ncbi:hypothetical protein PS15m_007590 [Mucor circinelloides]
MLTEVVKTPWSNTAYLHFTTVEGASVFFHKYQNRQLIINDAVFSVEEAKYRNGQTVKYAFKQINFTAAPAAAALSAAAAAMSTRVAAAHAAASATSATSASAAATSAPGCVVPAAAACVAPPRAAACAATSAAVGVAAAAAAPTKTTTASVSAAVPAAAVVHRISDDWRSSTKRALISINNEIKELKRRRKFLKKALEN